ncbi:hypothetical protein CDCA_CDCA02G0691 [Cyanidium caldarium]|uniref:Uncharacterized protein n=1 Tax=Cyanidium caldarium TaxID=2771 RepID=A0AAV9IR44_CYACA|nr:hypothetical protein CDCA_CDCA02G0691 [Cyanidium caldarium]
MHDKRIQQRFAQRVQHADALGRAPLYPRDATGWETATEPDATALASVRRARQAPGGRIGTTAAGDGHSSAMHTSPPRILAVFAQRRRQRPRLRDVSDSTASANDVATGTKRRYEYLVEWSVPVHLRSVAGPVRDASERVEDAEEGASPERCDEPPSATASDASGDASRFPCKTSWVTQRTAKRYGAEALSVFLKKQERAVLQRREAERPRAMDSSSPDRAGVASSPIRRSRYKR